MQSGHLGPQAIKITYLIHRPTSCCIKESRVDVLLTLWPDVGGICHLDHARCLCEKSLGTNQLNASGGAPFHLIIHLRPSALEITDTISTVASTPHTTVMAMSLLSRAWRPLFGRSWKPLTFPNKGFVPIPVDKKIEEETLPDYVASRYYPVRIGETFRERYQVVGKLGFGATSTVWLARDLK